MSAFLACSMSSTPLASLELLCYHSGRTTSSAVSADGSYNTTGVEEMWRETDLYARKEAQHGRAQQKRGCLLLRLAPHRGGLDGGKQSTPGSRNVPGNLTPLSLSRPSLRRLWQSELLSDTQSARVSPRARCGGDQRSRLRPLRDQLESGPGWPGSPGRLRTALQRYLGARPHREAARLRGHGRARVFCLRSPQMPPGPGYRPTSLWLASLPTRRNHAPAFSAAARLSLEY